MSKQPRTVFQNKTVNKISIGTSEGYTLIEFDSILYLHSENNYTTFHLEDNSKIIATKNLGYFEKRLAIGQFLRIHNTIIVNLNKIKGYVKAERGHIIISNNELLPISRNKKQNLIEFLKGLC